LRVTGAAMTSSSDAVLWRPLDLNASPAAATTDSGAFTATAPPRLPGPGGDLDWLPALRTNAELDAEATRRTLREDAYRCGREDASQSERERAEARCASALQAVAKVAAHLDSIADEFARDRERDVQGIAIAVARQVVQHELTIDPLRVGELVRRALTLLPQDHTLEVRLHPEDLGTLGASLERVLLDGRQVKLQWAADPGMERGGFIIETPQRIIDGRADVALRALYEKLDHD
jgi:flagellar biosynthesis/type III secretory pathway protein FliH